MELRHLEYFLMLCKTSNFTKAAEKLCVAQPSVTKAIQQLEQELGVVLFDRTQKPIAMTAEGKYFYERITSVLRDLEDAVQETQEISRMSARSNRMITIGMSPRTGLRLREMLMSAEPHTLNGILFNIVERANTEIYSMLMEERLHLGWIINTGRPVGLRFLPVETQEAYCILPLASPLAAQERLTFEELSGEDFAMDVEAGISALAQLVALRCRQAGYRPRISVHSPQHLPDIQVAQHLIQNGYGIMFSPVYDAMRLSGVAVRPMDPPLIFEVGLAWKDKRRQTAEERMFISYIQNKYPQFIQDYHTAGILSNKQKE